MPDLPPLAIVLVTYKRTAEAMATVNSTCLNLDYPQASRAWYIGDDGSPPEHANALVEFLRVRGEAMLGYSTERLRIAGHESTYHSGPTWNRALGIGHQYSDYVLWLEDDWRLDHPLDPRPYIKALAELDGTGGKPNVGLIRLGVLAVGNTVEIVGHDGVHYLRYLRKEQYCYSGNPCLRHARFTTHYGWFAEDRNPGEMELDYDTRFLADKAGPEIWRPAAINPWGAWGHIGTEKAYS